MHLEARITVVVDEAAEAERVGDAGVRLPDQRRRIELKGELPSPLNPPSGCPFQTRCRWKSKVPGGLCEREMPPMRTLAAGHQIKCHLSEAELDGMEPVITIAAE
mgnify:CR=1 FL=1